MWDDRAMSGEHPSMVAAKSSWRCVQAGDKQGWLDLMADDVCIEDPIGEGPTNPTGKGLRGKAEVSGFWDQHMAASKIEIEVHESYAVPLECAHVMTLRTTLPNGVVSRVRSIFTYRVDGEGKLTSLRGYWHMGIMEFEQPA
jgi:steroid delta-isomerase